MLCLLPFCKYDQQAAFRLLEWIHKLGRCPNHEILLLADCNVQWSDALYLLKQAQLTFKAARLVPTEKSCDFPWPLSANMMFMAGAKAAGQPFFWLEPDAVPLKAKWLETLDSAYKKCGKPFMGPVMECTQPGLPPRYMAGTACYPADALKYIEPMLRGRAWDIDSADLVLPQAAHTDLIHHLWGEPSNPPTFAEHNVPGTNMFCLNQINPKAVVFHRNKDGSLIRLLKGEVERDLIVVVAFCGKDSHITLKNFQWQQQLSGKQPFDLVLAHDQHSEYMSEAIEEAAGQCYRSMQKIKYSLRESNWPQAPNAVFQMMARHMQDLKRPWLWMEPDAIPLKSNWLPSLQNEYLLGRRPFMGAIVPQMGHMNGVGIYPANTPDLIPRAMRATHGAWDTDMREEMIDKCHDASHLIQHCWGIVSGCANPHGGDLPHFRDESDLARWLIPSAVLFHRCKDGSLIDQLQKK